MALTAIAAPPQRKQRSFFARVKELGPAGLLGLFFITLVIVLAIGAPILTFNDPGKSNLEVILKPPNFQYWFGTDMLGRDIYARIVFGARISLLVSISAVLFGHGTGALIGIFSAYMGGYTDLVIQRVMDALQSFPLLILAVAIVAFLGPSLGNVILSLAIVIIPSSQRVVRSSALVIKEQQYIEAAKVLGADSRRIMTVHLLPNVTAPIIVLASASLGTAVLVEASLSFLGLGPPPPTPTWGSMLSAAAAQYMEIAPWTAIFPGMAISITVLGFNLLGDAVRDVWDPRLRGR